MAFLQLVHFSLIFSADLCLREVVLYDLVGFWVSVFRFSDVCVLVVCCGCSDLSLVVEHCWFCFSRRSLPSSSSESVCRWVGCCSSGVVGVHHGHKNVLSVTGILSLSMQGL